MNQELKQAILKICDDNYVHTLESDAYKEFEVRKPPMYIRLRASEMTTAGMFEYINISLRIKENDVHFYTQHANLRSSNLMLQNMGASDMTATQRDLLDIYVAMCAKVREQDLFKAQQDTHAAHALEKLKSAFGDYIIKSKVR